MSAPRIIAQGVPCQIVSFPGWGLPTLVTLKAVMSGGLAWVVTDAETSPSLLVTGSLGIYVVTFPAAKAIKGLNIDVWPALPGTDAQNRKVSIDPAVANTFAGNAGNSRGQITLYTVDMAGAEVAPVASSELHVSFWADYGK